MAKHWDEIIADLKHQVMTVTKSVLNRTEEGLEAARQDYVRS